MTEIQLLEQLVAQHSQLIEINSAIAGFVVAICLCKGFDKLFP